MRAHLIFSFMRQTTVYTNKALNTAQGKYDQAHTRGDPSLTTHTIIAE